VRAIPHHLVLRGASSMAAAAIGCGIDPVEAIERANNIAQVLSAEGGASVSATSRVVRDLVRKLEPAAGRHDLVASMGAAWSVTLAGYPLSELAEALYQRELVRRQHVSLAAITAREMTL